MFGGIGFGEIIVIFFVILLLFGAKRLPEIARSLGTSIFEFKKGMNDSLNQIKEVMDEQNTFQPGVRKTKTVSADSKKGIICSSRLKKD